MTLQVLQEMAAGWAGRPGADLLRGGLALVRYGSDSPLESRIRLVLHDGGFPDPDLQITVTVNGVTYRIDLGWTRWRVGIEGDGEGVHATPEAVFADRFRQNALQNARWHLLRFTWRDVTRRPWYIVETVREALSERGAA